ncbi:MAG: glycoside hydrolase family 3 C-terminal domain-containing protein [Terracidiphilus sp.]
MRTFGLRLAAALAVCGAAFAVFAQDAQKPAYLNPKLPAEVRAADLVHQMTLQEKASQLVNQARAIPRLGVPAYDWWSEALHGDAVNGTTEFPEPIGLGATFDPAGVHAMAVDIGIEGRIEHEQSVRDHSNPFHHGLDFWAPNINIFRDPRWGRGQETYGEDPFLTGRMAVAFVTGMQGDDPHYYRVIATPKHFDVHSGPEPMRHMFDVAVSKHDEMDTYLPAFRAAIVAGKADSIMCAYNSINGQPACANQFLLDDMLRGKWNFQGYVVSDCDAVHDIFSGHYYEPTLPQAAAVSMERGMDNDCADFRVVVTDDHDYKPYIEAVQEGYLKESDVDRALIRLFTARMKLGMFDPPSMVPYTKFPESDLNSPAHRELALKLADESMVLLKNDGTLPLKTSGIKIAVVGPLANETAVLLGNYSGTPTHTVSILEGIKKEFAGDTISYVPGTDFLMQEHPKPRPDGWSQADLAPDPAAIAAAKNADVVIAVVGITSRLEGEEMRVDEPGFLGGDRVRIDLPQPEENLIRALGATGKPLVVVLTNGSALAVNWAKEHANAILDAWYPGEEGGTAVADTLSGSNDPAGRLPVTFYTGIDQLPSFVDYSMKNRTYRYFEGKPLYPFGYGLSYTKFSYSGLTIPAKEITAGKPLAVEVTVTNTGSRAGDEVAELYLNFPEVPGAPLRALRSFERIHLDPGASQKVRFELSPRDMSMVTEAGEPIVAEGKYTVSVGGGQPDTGVQVLTANFNVKGTVTLPE